MLWVGYGDHLCRCFMFLKHWCRLDGQESSPRRQQLLRMFRILWLLQQLCACACIMAIIHHCNHGQHHHHCCISLGTWQVQACMMKPTMHCCSDGWVCRCVDLSICRFRIWFYGPRPAKQAVVVCVCVPLWCVLSCLVFVLVRVFLKPWSL